MITAINLSTPINIRQNPQRNNPVKRENLYADKPFFTPKISFGANPLNWAKGELKGYEKQLKDLYNILISPIHSLDYIVAPIVVIYSPDKILAKMVKNCVTKALSDVNITEIKNCKPELFSLEISKNLEKCRNSFGCSRNKSLIVADNIENYINISTEKLPAIEKDFGKIFSEQDYQFVKKNNNSNNINNLKSIADYCSEIPHKNNDLKAAATIFSVSDRPYLINPELLRRPEKVYTIVFPPIQGGTFVSLLSKEVAKQSDNLNNLRCLPLEDIQSLDFPYKSRKKSD